MIMRIFSSFFVVLCMALSVQAYVPEQHGPASFNGSVGVGDNTTANSKLILDVKSTTKAMAPPRMTTTQQNAISSPVEGSFLFDTTLHFPAWYTGSAWKNPAILTPNQYGVVLSGSASTLTVLAPDASITKVLTSGGASANPTWSDPASITETVNAGLCTCRVSLTSGTAVTTSDVTAATTVYFAPFKGNKIALYNGSTAWAYFTLTQISIAVPATTNTNYDLFVYDSSGLTLEAVAWTDATTRATAIVFQDGVYVKSGSTTKRYVGSFRTTGSSGQTEDSLAKRYVFSYYNRMKRPMQVLETTDSWAYTTATWRQARATATNQLDLLIGVSEDPVSVIVSATVTNSQAGVSLGLGIGLDSTSANAAGTLYQQPSSDNGTATATRATWTGYITLGRHVITWLEYSQALGTTTWYGDAGGTTLQSGITGESWQ